MTVDELATALGLAAATVRRHLDILQRDQLVSWTEARGQTGRPHYVFFLTDTGHERLPRQYDRLASLLLGAVGALNLRDIKGRTGEEVLDIAMSRVGRLLANEYRDQVKGTTLGDRVIQVVEVLGKEYLAAECDMDEDAYRIHCYNCPFLRVATSHPVVCLAHQEMLSSLLATDARREESMAQGKGRCTYVVPRVAEASPAPWRRFA